MQKILVIIFAVAFLFKPAIPVVEYWINYDYIVAELCVNKDNENSTCNGKCHLTSELADASESADGSVPDRKQHIKVDVLFIIAIAEYHLTRFTPIIRIVHCHSADRYNYLGAGAIFHPPILV